MNKGIGTYLIFAVIPFLVSCSHSGRTGNVPLARVDQNVLFLSDIQEALPQNLSSEDSILYAENFIRNWINNELMIKKAQENLDFSQKDVARELRDYRNSLIIYRYQMALMQEKLDTNVTPDEILQIYDSVRKDFILDSDLVKAVFFKIPLSVTHPERVKAFCESTSSQNQQELEQFCRNIGGSCEMFPDHWVGAHEIFGKLPYQPVNIRNFLTQYTSWETRDSRFYYLVHIQDYALSGTSAPPGFIRDNLKELIINKRKNAFLDEITKDIYMEGLKNNRFKIYEYDSK